MSGLTEAPRRLPALQRVIDLTRAGLDRRIGTAPAAAGVIGEIFARLELVAPLAPDPVSARLPVCDHVAPALAEAERRSPDIAALARAFADVAPRLAWARRRGSERQADHFADNHANATMIGPGGLEARDDVWIGASVMAAGTQYPDHSHPPEEVYLALSDGEWRQHDHEWHSPGVGGLVHNPPGIVHAMRSGAAPLLAIWCLLLH